MKLIGRISKEIPYGNYVATWSGWNLSISGIKVKMMEGIRGTVTTNFFVDNGRVFLLENTI